MKELSIEEKAKRYDEAIKKLRDFYRDYDTASRLIDVKEELANLFPEFKESEDERIKEELNKVLDECLNVRPQIVEEKQYIRLIAWLEKQDIFSKKDIDDAYLKGVEDTKNEIEKQYEANYQIRKDIATFIFNYKGDIKDRAKWINYLGIKVSFVDEQGEKRHKFIIGDIISNNNTTYRVDNIVKNCIGQDSYFLVNVERENKGMRHLKLTDPRGKTYNFGEITWLCEQVDAKFEKQGKSALEAIKEKNVDNADKVEPKFKVGDWVFIEEVKGYKQGAFQINSIDEFGYNFDEYHTIPFMYEELLSKWTVHDAKDGDALVTNSNIIFIFKFLDEGGTIAFRASCTENSGVYFPKIKERLCDQEVQPATKEQRDLLFQKMKEAGLEWDAEKKELKKL